MRAKLLKPSLLTVSTTAAALLTLLAFGSSPAAANGCIDPAAGTAGDPFLINNVNNLLCLRNNGGYYWHNGFHFKQTADIDLTGEAWTPIGSTGTAFNGEYDGDNHLISGMTVNSGGGRTGLFGYTGGGAVIKNLRVQGTVNSPGGSWVGGVAGIADYHTEIINVHASVDVNAGNGVGGLVGFLPESTVSRSSSTGAVTGTGGGVGGLVGYARGQASYSPGTRPAAEIIDSYATGPVTGGVGYSGVAGLLGYAASSTPGVNITRSYSTGLVTGGAGQRQDCPGDPGDPCYTVDGTSGGLVASAYFGVPNPRLFVNEAFWDTQTSSQSTTADGKGTGATTSQMKSLATFSAASWNISNGWSPTDTWGICDGQSYPFLNAQFTSSPCPPPSPNPEPTPTPGPNPTPDPAPTPPGPAPTPAPTPVPSTSVTVRLPRLVGGKIRTLVQVPGAGQVSQLGTFSTTGSSSTSRAKGACRAAAVDAPQAGTVRMSCVLTDAAKNARRGGAVRVRLVTTFRPTGGTPRMVSRIFTLRSLKPRYTG